MGFVRCHPHSTVYEIVSFRFHKIGFLAAHGMHQFIGSQNVSKYRKISSELKAQIVHYGHESAVKLFRDVKSPMRIE